MGSAAENLVAKLECIKSNGEHRWKAKCPAHDDKNPSLSVTEIDEGVLVHCFAGCHVNDVLSAVGLEPKDLFNESKTKYEYDNGRVVVRAHSPRKSFKQWNTKNKPELYRLERVRDVAALCGVILICEGEKDCHAADLFTVAQSRNFVATTAPQGASNWDKVDYRPVLGAQVVIAVDDDEAGLKRGRELYTHLTSELGMSAATVSVLKPAVGKDIADHVAAGKDFTDLVKVQTLPTQDPESWFWQSRETLTKVRQQARARRVAPFSCLGAVLALTVARVDPNVTLPAIVGGRGSLNLFTALVGMSGGGKGASDAAATELMDFRGDRLFRVERRTLGSGEGLSAAFVERIKGEEGSEVVHHTDGVCFNIAEIDTLGALGSRAGSTIMPELRKVWSGEQLGFQNRDRATSLPVEAHSYRATLIAGVQPERSSVLLDEQAGGTPQRFVWFSTEDRQAPEKAPAAPEQIRWENPNVDVLPLVDGARIMNVCDEAWSEIEQAQVRRLKGDGHALDGHALYSRLKVAAALSLLEQRGDVTSEDWELAGVVMTHSNQTRELCLRALSNASRNVNEQRALARVDAAVKAEDHLVGRCMERIIDRLTNDWQGGAAIRKGITPKLRDHFDTALDALLEAGRIEQLLDEYNGKERARYRLADVTEVTKLSPLPITPENPRDHAEVSGDKTQVTESSPLSETVTTESDNEDREEPAA